MSWNNSYNDITKKLFFFPPRPKMPHSRVFAGKECGTFSPVEGIVYMKRIALVRNSYLS